MPHAIRRLSTTVRIRQFPSWNIRTMSSYPVRRFAPLDATAAAEEGVPKLDGIIFDVDGTLCTSPDPFSPSLPIPNP